MTLFQDDDDAPGFEIQDGGLSQDAQQSSTMLEADASTSQFIGDNLVAEPKKVRPAITLVIVVRQS